MQPFFFFEFPIWVINHYHINVLFLFWENFEWFCLQISSDAKYFPLLSKALWSRINSCYSILFSNLNKKKNTILSLAVFLAVTWVSCILKHPIILLVKLLAVTWVSCILRHPILCRALTRIRRNFFNINNIWKRQQELHFVLERKKIIPKFVNMISSIKIIYLKTILVDFDIFKTK